MTSPTPASASTSRSEIPVIDVPPNVVGTVFLAGDFADKDARTFMLVDIVCSRCSRQEQFCPCPANGGSMALIRVREQRCYG